MNETQSRDGRAGEGRRTRGSTSPWEWVAAGISLLLVLGAIGFMAYEAIGAPDGPPRIHVEVDSVVAGGDSYLVEVRIRNSGPSTAADLVVEGQLHADTGVVETSEVTIQFVPGGATRRAGLFFRLDPRLYRMEIRPKGFDRP